MSYVIINLVRVNWRFAKATLKKVWSENVKFMCKKVLRLGIVGLGKNRGYELLKTFQLVENAEIVAVCDCYAERVDAAVEYLREKADKVPFTCNDYRHLLAQDIDAVIIASPWETHVEIAVQAMEKNIIVGMEVGGAYSIDDIWLLVRTWERTKTPFMFLENCCYDRAELYATRLVREGLLGEIVHASGAYAHDLRNEVFTGVENKHYRYRNYLHRNGETYPTHDLGPIAKILGIQRGNRMVSLVSVASKAAGLKEYAKGLGKESPNFKQGDIVTTIITCANGETILLKLDTTLPGFYDRAFTVRGTKGMYTQTLHATYLDSDEELPNETCWSNAETLLNNSAKYEERYLPTVWKNITQEELKAGHGGMDLIMMREFVNCALEGKEMPIDVYDAAAWMSITCLSEQSVAMGGAPQIIPDFTGGKWLVRELKDVMDLS